MSHAYAVTNYMEALAAASMTWSSGITTYRAYLQDRRMDNLFYSSASGETLTSVVIDMGAAVSLKGFAFLNHNLATWSSPTILIEGADDAAITTNVVTAKASTSINKTAPNHKDCVLNFSSTSKRYWRIKFNDAGATRTLILGELMALTTVTTLNRTKIYGHGESEQYFVNQVQSMTGEVRSNFLAGPFRTKNIPFSDLDSNDLVSVMTMFRATYGGSLPMLWIEQICTTTSASTYAEMECIWGKMQQEMDWTEGDFNLFTPSSFVIRSLGREVGA